MKSDQICDAMIKGAIETKQKNAFPHHFNEGMDMRTYAAIRLYPLFIAENLKCGMAGMESARSATLRTIECVDILLEGLEK